MRTMQGTLYLAWSSQLEQYNVLILLSHCMQTKSVINYICKRMHKVYDLSVILNSLIWQAASILPQYKKEQLKKIYKNFKFLNGLGNSQVALRQQSIYFILLQFVSEESKENNSMTPTYTTVYHKNMNCIGTQDAYISAEGMNTTFLNEYYTSSDTHSKTYRGTSRRKTITLIRKNLAFHFHQIVDVLVHSIRFWWTQEL